MEMTDAAETVEAAILKPSAARLAVQYPPALSILLRLQSRAVQNHATAGYVAPARLHAHIQTKNALSGAKTPRDATQVPVAPAQRSSAKNVGPDAAATRQRR